MKAAICTKYGEPSFLRVEEVAKPAPKKDQILVKIHSSSVTSGDSRIRRADPYIIRYIRI
jgi:NADPH:quinone reductase-like Zn-dependent oxidoreductase